MYTKREEKRIRDVETAYRFSIDFNQTNTNSLFGNKQHNL